MADRRPPTALAPTVWGAPGDRDGTNEQCSSRPAVPCQGTSTLKWGPGSSSWKTEVPRLGTCRCGHRGGGCCQAPTHCETQAAGSSQPRWGESTSAAPTPSTRVLEQGGEWHGRLLPSSPGDKRSIRGGPRAAGRGQAVHAALNMQGAARRLVPNPTAGAAPPVHGRGGNA